MAVDGRGLLITGNSGSGKSSLALELISRGATLVADDRVVLLVREDALIASPPRRLAGLIEARGVGLLELPYTTTSLAAVLDLDITETDRLPHMHNTVIGGVSLPHLRKVESPAFAAILLAYLRGGRRET